jgi:hypothetical protein
MLLSCAAYLVPNVSIVVFSTNLLAFWYSYVKTFFLFF